MATRCIRCGSTGHVEYGPNGLPYCNSCIFYAMNRQCWRCRMYIPYTELQQYKGQWYCPICLNDVREDDQRASVYSTSEVCENCGADVALLYTFNGKRLCKVCLENAKHSGDDFKGRKPPKGGAFVLIVKTGSSLLSMLEDLIIAVFRIFGIRLKKRFKRKINDSEVVALKKRKPPSILGRNRGLTEGLMKDKSKKPMSEGIFKKKSD